MVGTALSEKETSLLWTRCLLELPENLAEQLPPIGSLDDAVDEIVGDRLELSRNAAIDGSGLDPLTPALRRCGWAAAFVDEDGRPLRQAYGPLPMQRQTVPCAELFALWRILVGMEEGDALQ